MGVEQHVKIDEDHIFAHVSELKQMKPSRNDFIATPVTDKKSKLVLTLVRYEVLNQTIC